MPETISQPISAIDRNTDAIAIEPGIALCLSGGGYRAMIFHLAPALTGFLDNRQPKNKS
jgi:hypothetical protein